MRAPAWDDLPIPADLTLHRSTMPTGRHVGWIDEVPRDRLAELQATLAAAFPTTGVWPIAIPTGYLEWTARDPYRVEHGCSSDVADVSSVNVEGLFAELARDDWPEPDPPTTLTLGESVVPLENRLFQLAPEVPPLPSRAEAFRGLAPGPGHPHPERLDPRHLCGLDEFDGLGLVQVLRPADVLAAIDWATPNGPMYGTTGSAVLRSWEDRFGIVVTGLTAADMEIHCPLAPLSQSQAELLAGEYYAFDPDGFGQSLWTWQQCVESTRDRRSHIFWWD